MAAGMGSTETLRVALGELSYGIIIGGGLLGRAGEFLQSLGIGKRGVIITDIRVERLYVETLQAGLRRAGRAITSECCGWNRTRWPTRCGVAARSRRRWSARMNGRRGCGRF